MFNLLSHQGNANLNNPDTPPQVRMAKIKTQLTANAHKDVEEEEYSFMAGLIDSCYNYSGS